MPIAARKRKAMIDIRVGEQSDVKRAREWLQLRECCSATGETQQRLLLNKKVSRSRCGNGTSPRVVHAWCTGVAEDRLSNCPRKRYWRGNFARGKHKG